MAEEPKNTRSRETKGTKERHYVELDHLLKVLDCPVCWRRSEPENLIQCRNGHSGCRSCFSRLKTCPLCRQILQPEIKSFSEDILDLILRELRHVENQKVFPKTFVTLFKCVNCQFTPTKGPVYQCQKGHVHCYRPQCFFSFCGSCIIKPDYKFPGIAIRSLTVQELLRYVPKPCRFTKHGCSKIIKGFSQHEDSCKFSEIYCLIPYCGHRVSLPRILTHILGACNMSKYLLYPSDPRKFTSTSYGGATIPWRPDTKFISWDCGRVDILKLGVQQYFTFTWWPVTHRSEILFYTYYLGPAGEAKNFHYELILKFKKDGPSIERKAPVISTNVCKFEVSSHPDVITISFSEIREALKMETPLINFAFGVEVFENGAQISDAVK